MSSMAAPTHSAAAENNKPRAKPVAGEPVTLSAIAPTTEGPTIWPMANTIVNAAIPVGQSDARVLCRTSAVVEATTDKNTAPNNTPENNSAGHTEVSAGSSTAAPNSAFRVAKARPLLCRANKPAQMREEATTASPSNA